MAAAQSSYFLRPRQETSAPPWDRSEALIGGASGHGSFSVVGASEHGLLSVVASGHGSLSAVGESVVSGYRHR